MPVGKLLLPAWEKGGNIELSFGLSQDQDIKENTEDLRRRLLNDVYAGAFSGIPAMILDEKRIRDADEEELKEIVRQYGMR